MARMMAFLINVEFWLIVIFEIKKSPMRILINAKIAISGCVWSIISD